MRKFISYSIVVILILLSITLFAMKHQDLLEMYTVAAMQSILIIGVSSVVYYLLLSKRMSFYENFFHELTHMLFSLLFFEDIKHFFASQTKGEVVTSSTFRNILTQSAPYFFPVLTLLLIATWPMHQTGVISFLVPVSYGIYLSIVVKQIFEHKQEILSLKWIGVLFVLLMNFWVSLYVFLWYADNSELFINLF